MMAIFLRAFPELISRRVGMVLVGLALLMPALHIYGWSRSLERLPDGSFVVHAGPTAMPVHDFLRSDLSNQLTFAHTFWVLLAIFATAPALTTFQERGWAELLFSKGLRRWEVLLGRYLAGLTAFAVALFFICGVPALYVWWTTGITQYRFFTGLGLTLLSFASLLSLMALVSVLQVNAALLVMVGFVQFTFARFLATRGELYVLIPWDWLKTLLDWLYYLLPKNAGLQRAATTYLTTATFVSWWLLWTTAVFAVAALAAACVLLQRKNI